MFVLLVAAPRAVLAQAAEDTTVVSATAVQESPPVPVPPVSAGGAFLRSVLVPGWGQAANGAYNRAGFYLVAESGTAWMLLRVRRRIRAAQDVRALRAIEAEAALRAEGRMDPDSIANLVDQDPAVTAADGLVDARKQQFTDWLSLGIFLVFLSGADAFVTAHLTDFPQPIQLETAVVGPGAVEVRVTVPLGGPGRR